MRSRFDTIARRAGSQHGRISHAQLIAAGVDRDRIKRWRSEGRLRPVYIGVYAVGHEAPSLHGDLMSAVLACGHGAVLSHRSAAHALKILPARPARPEVTKPTTSGYARHGIVVHRVRAIDPLDIAVLDAIKLTTVPRVLLDLAPSLLLEDLARACHEAWIGHQVTPRLVEACIARNPTKNGAAKLRLALGTDVTLSKLEDGFLSLLDRHDLPRPRTNVDLAVDKVDCHWPRHDLTVELLSYRFHASRQAFETDVARRRRSNHLALHLGRCVRASPADRVGARCAAALTARSRAHALVQGWARSGHRRYHPGSPALVHAHPGSTALPAGLSRRARWSAHSAADRT